MNVLFKNLLFLHGYVGPGGRSERPPASPSSPPRSPGVFELRDYTLHPGQRDVLVDLFEREFIEAQEALGMRVLAHFRDLDAPDRFVWFRGFAGMAHRGEALPAFYRHGEAWQAHRDAANATMRDSDNVLLLREAWPGSGFASGGAHPPVGETPSKSCIVVVTYAFAQPVDATVCAFFRDTVLPLAAGLGARPLATFATEEAANNFPALPVREGEHVVVSVSAFDDTSAHANFAYAVATDARWQREVAAFLRPRSVAPPQVRRLQACARSAVRG
ncbi:MAG TPA: NIPSNAP family protein [Xanthomonadaceae bacterium]|nr:NIPSNAP family protein [Xanthomonadaceae bacterium]